MSQKLDFDKLRRRKGVVHNGHEPIAMDYAEFPSKYSHKMRVAVPAAPSDEWGDGEPNFQNRQIRIRYLRLVEDAFRRGQQPIISDAAATELIRQIEAIRQNPDVRKSYHNAVAKRRTGRTKPDAVPILLPRFGKLRNR